MVLGYPQLVAVVDGTLEVLDVVTVLATLPLLAERYCYDLVLAVAVELLAGLLLLVDVTVVLLQMAAVMAVLVLVVLVLSVV